MYYRVLLFVTSFSLGPVTAAADPVFGLTKRHTVQITLPAKAFAEMDPPPRPFVFGPPPAAPGRPIINPADQGAGNLEFDFPYVRTDLVIDGTKYASVGLRYKGSGSYMASMRNAKRSLKIDFDKYTPNQTFHGHAKLNLNSGVMDPSKAREALAYSVFRAAGVPSCRTAYADVTLTVPGKFDKEYLGLYTAVEQIDKAFLATNFKNAQGLLLKPEGIRGLAYLGETPEDYAKIYNVKSGESVPALKRLIAFTKLVNRADDATFAAEIEQHLDLDSFAKFLAANVMLASLDGFIGMGHNYYLYLSPVTNRFHFIPWDLDLAFGGFFLFGPADQLAELSVERPYQGENALLRKLLAMPTFKADYRAHVKRLAETVFVPSSLGKEIAETEAMAKEPLAREKKAAEARKEGGGGFGMPMQAGPTMSLNAWVAKRAASVLDQLEGKKKGHMPEMMTFGPPPGGGFGPGQPLAKPLFDRLDVNRDGRVTETEFRDGMQKLFREWDRDAKGTLDLKQLTDGLQKLTPPPPGPGWKP